MMEGGCDLSIFILLGLLIFIFSNNFFVHFFDSFFYFSYILVFH